MLATAVAEKLHATYPQAKIDFLVRKGNEGLLAGHPFLNEVIVWDKKKGKYKNLLKALSKIRANKYDLVVNLQRFAASGFLTAFSGGKIKVGYKKNPFSGLFTKAYPHEIGKKGNEGDPRAIYLHEVQRNQKMIAEFTDETFAKPHLYPSETDFKAIEQYTRLPYITISPASVWFTKQFPVDKWIEFAREASKKYRVYLLGGGNDDVLCEDIRKANPEKMINFAGSLSFLQTTALMRDAVMNYTNDSAPMHFASAINAPVAAVYCSTIPEFGFGPLSDKSFVVEVQENLECRPCGLHGLKACPLGHFNCARHIKIEQLTDLL